MSRLPALLVLALIALFWPARAGDGLPADEAGLLQFAGRHDNRREWRLSERALRRCLELFPKGEQADRARFELGRLYLNLARRPADGREQFETLLRDFPETRYRWQARYLVGVTFEREREAEKALAVFRAMSRDCPDDQWRSNAAHAVLRVQNKNFQISVHGSFGLGEPIAVDLGLRNVYTAELRLLRVPYDELAERLDGNQNVQQAALRVPRERCVEIRQWTGRFLSLPGRYKRHRVEAAVESPGVYRIEAEHDGVRIHVTALVNRYGLVTRAAAGKVLVFAQDRATGEPVAGMRLRFQRDKKTHEDVTNDAGVCFADAPGNSMVVGIHEGEWVFANQVYGAAPTAAESLYYVLTDRPVYRPSQQVRFKVVHRIDDDGALRVADGLTVRVRIQDPRGNALHERDYPLDAFGACAGEFRLGEEPALGDYHIAVSPRSAAPPVRHWRGSVGNFRVDEYKKPEFKVGVEFSQERYLQADELEATIGAEYYFGGPAANATVQWRILMQPHWRWWGRPHWYDWYGEVQHHQGGAEVARGHGRTDAAGRLAVSWKIPRGDHDARYVVVANVTDLSRRTVEGSADVLATQAEFALQARWERSVYRRGDEALLRVRALRHDGTPEPKRRIDVQLVQHRTRHGDSMDKKLFLAQLVTDERGEATLRWKAPLPGRLEAILRADDARGNRITVRPGFWCADDEWDGGSVVWDAVDIVADRESYAPGDTATFLVTSSEKDLHLLLTIEGRRIHHHQVVKLHGHTTAISFEIDDAALVPNFHVQLSALHGNKFYTRSRSIVVDPSDRFLDVKVRARRDRYRPREKATFEITTTNPQGDPVAAQVALSAVDDAIYALQSEYAPDIRKFFVHARWNRVQGTSSIQQWAWGRAEGVLRADGESGDDGPGAPAAEKAGARRQMAATVIRSRFADTMFWAPFVTTGADGRATYELPEVADNLTTWRLKARAITRDGLVGEGSSTVLVTKEVLVRLQTPRFLTQGDRTTISAIVHNNLDHPKTIHVDLVAGGLLLVGEPRTAIEVPAHGERRVDWTVAAQQAGTATLQVRALSDEVSDAMRLEIPVLPHGSLAWTSRAGLIEGEVVETFELADDLIPDTTQLTLSVAPTHAATVLDALDYLADYPYGCVEQTMSRFLPSVITARVLRQLGIERPGLEKQLPDMIRTGLQRLYHFQHGDGGWGWWKNDASNPFTTAYVVYGLALARDADAPVDGNVLARGVQAVRAHLEKADDAETRVYLLHALSAAGTKVPAVRNALADDLKTLAPAAKAMLALVLHRDGEAKQARRVLAALAADAVQAGAGAHWAGDEQYRWTGSTVEATAFALKALLAIAPDHELVPRAVAWLAMHRDGAYWISTRQTATVVFAVADYLARTGRREMNVALSVEVNGTSILKTRVTRDNRHAFEGTFDVDRKLLKAGGNRIVFKSSGEGTPVYSLFLRRFRRAEKFVPSTGGLQVERRYDRVVDGDQRAPLADGAQVESGDEIEVTLTVTADRPYRHLMLEDALPAGFEPVRERAPRWYGRAWSHWYAHREFRDDKVEIAVTYLPQGKQQVSYRLRAETPGTVRALPAVVWNMYRPGEGANSAGVSFQVLERK